MNTTAEIQVRLLEGTIEALRGLRTFGDHPNMWCDIIYDEQENAGYLLDEPYRDAVLGILTTLIRKLPDADMERLWLTTDRGWEYAFEKEWQEKGGESDEDELAGYYRTKDDRVDDVSHHLLGQLREMAYKADIEAEQRRNEPGTDASR